MDCSDGPWQLRELISVPSWIICTKYHSLAWKWRQVSSREGGKVTWKKCCSVHFPSFQVELSKFWRDPASELSDVFANEVFCLAGVASMGCNCINIDITTIIRVFTNASVGWSYIRKLSHLPRCNKGPSVANIIWEELDLLSTLHSLAKITINFYRRPLLVPCRAFG